MDAPCPGMHWDISPGFHLQLPKDTGHLCIIFCQTICDRLYIPECLKWHWMPLFRHLDCFLRVRVKLVILRSSPAEAWHVKREEETTPRISVPQAVALGCCSSISHVFKSESVLLSQRNQSEIAVQICLPSGQPQAPDPGGKARQNAVTCGFPVG